MGINDIELEKIIQLITQRTGIIPRASHRDGIKSYVEKKLSEKKCTVQNYLNAIIADSAQFSDLVNESTVNETYFFREERQFALLKQRIFPMWRALNGSVPIKIWSAACSYGEEPYSLALLATQCNVKAQITASDINSEVLEHCRKGEFLSSSIRQVDGLQFKPLLDPYIKTDNKIHFPSEITSLITTKRINLSMIDSPSMDSLLPKNQNIIFLRNVFIYFNQDLRSRILHTIAQKCLADGGVLFVSMSEIAQLDSSVMPPSFEKVMDGSVFYFHKKEREVGLYGKNLC